MIIVKMARACSFPRSCQNLLDDSCYDLQASKFRIDAPIDSPGNIVYQRNDQIHEKQEPMLVCRAVGHGL